MLFPIDAETLAATTHCKQDHRCIMEKDYSCGTVQHSVSEKVIFVKCSYMGHCHYKMSFGASFVCHCPIRKEFALAG